MKKDEALRLALEALGSNRRTHHYCEDTWYSCPKHEDGCANDSEGDECNCGADEANAGIDQAITAIKAALEAKDEPVAWYVERQHEGFRDHGLKYGPFWKRDDALEWCDDNHFLKNHYTTPPQRKPLTEQEIGAILEDINAFGTRLYTFARAVEAAHGIKGKA